NWIVKASKLCNLRCRYCYEWNDLHRGDRIQLPQWWRLLEAVRDYHLLLRESFGSERGVRSNIIWHGGEPLVLPPAYFEQVFDASRAMPVRFLPLFDAPLNTPEAVFSLTARATVAALERLFDYWIQCRRRIAVRPLIDYVYTALLRRTGESRQTYDRSGVGEWALLVNTDGTLYHRPDAYDAVLALGNVFQQGIRDILASEAYAESLRRDARLVQRFCDGCEYRGACNTIPIFESPRKA